METWNYGCVFETYIEQLHQKSTKRVDNLMHSMIKKLPNMYKINIFS